MKNEKTLTGEMIELINNFTRDYPMTAAEIIGNIEVTKFFIMRKIDKEFDS